MSDQYRDEGDLILCENCGEEYAATYRACPFCGEPRVGRKSRGSTQTRRTTTRRKAKTNTRGGGYGGDRNPLSIIGIILSVILILAAIIIVFSLIKSTVSSRRAAEDKRLASQSAMVNVKGDNETSSQEASSEASASDSSSADEATDEEAAPEDASDESARPSSDDLDTPVSMTIYAAGEGEVDDETLTEGESLQLTAKPNPSDWEGQIIWSSSDGAVASVDQTGLLRYVARGTCTVTASAGDVKAECTVRCR